PYLVRLSQVLHVDALLAPLMTASALAGLLYWVGGRDRRDLALSAVAGGLALLTKAPAVHSVLFFGLVGLVSARRDLRGLLAIPAWGLIAGGIYVALWLNPVGRLGDVVYFVQSVGGE